jgi:hypothetical protein
MAEATEGGEQGDLLAAAAAPEGGVETPEAPAGSEAAAPVTDAQPSASSTDEGVKKPSQLDAVMKALGREDGAEASPAAESEDQDKDTPDPDGKAAPADEAPPAALEGEDAKLPFARHPRFRQLLTQRNEFKAKASEIEAKLKVLEPKAQHFEQLTQYAVAANFTSKDFQDLLHMGRLMKNDPIAFHEAFKSQWAEIEQLVGARLPEDLERKVNDGLIDEESARELARKRGEASLNGERAERITRQTAQEREQAASRDHERQQQELVSNLQGTANRWEAQWKGSDPDYAIKQPLVQEKIELALFKKPPASPEEALAIFNQAKKDVDEQIKRLRPPPGSVRTTGSGTSVNAKGVPKDPIDAAMMAIENMGSR